MARDVDEDSGRPFIKINHPVAGVSGKPDEQIHYQGTKLRMSENDDPRIDIERFGPGSEVIDAVSQTVLNHPSVREYLGGARHRLLSVRLLDPAVEGKPDEPMPPDRYRATIYDYTNNRVVLANGRLDDIRGSMEVSQAGYQPIPTRDEFDEAVEVVLEDEDLGPAIQEQRLAPYRPMPPPRRGRAPGRPRGAHARSRAYAPGARGAPRADQRCADVSIL